MIFKKNFNKTLITILLLMTGLAGYFYLNKLSSLFKEKLTACNSIENNSTQNITETTRLFINLPKDVYPDKEHNLRFETISGNTTAGWISNAGQYGEAFQATQNCWSYYYEFDGIGETDLKVKSSMFGMPDYFVRFIVKQTR